MKKKSLVAQEVANQLAALGIKGKVEIASPKPIKAVRVKAGPAKAGPAKACKKDACTTPCGACPVKPKPVTHVIFVLDDSGSMRNCFETAVQQLNQNLQQLKLQSSVSGQTTYVSLVTFSSAINLVWDKIPIEQVTRIPGIFANGSRTRLRDAIGETVTRVMRCPDEISYLLICATDGSDNGSFLYNIPESTAVVAEAQKTDRWTMAFLAPPGQKPAVAAYLGIPLDNVIEWENSSVGAKAAFGAVAAATNDYMLQRSRGVTSTKKFFVETNLANLTKAEVWNKLKPTYGFKFAAVEKEQDIKEFAQEKTGKPYVIGSVYYALTKTEDVVQAGKEVLLVEKGTKEVWGGPEARRLIGLPDGQAARVSPGNHAIWDIYIKSTSVNRKLVRGTKVLIDMMKAQSDAETWDSVAAKALADAKAAAAANNGFSSSQ